MPAVHRKYRVRIATRGAAEVEGNVEFVLSARGEGDEKPLMGPPVVTGTRAHPLDGATEMRPFVVEGVDRSEELIQACADDGRWVLMGRLLDVQWQLEEDDPDTDPWETYGTGRCSGLDELDGPGKFRLTVSDESWVSRTGRAFGGVTTTQIWPAGPIYDWRGRPAVGWGSTFQGSGGIIDQSGDLYRIRLTKRINGYESFVPIMDRGSVTDSLLRYIRSHQMEELNFATMGREGGNFRHLRLYYQTIAFGPPDPVGPWQGWEIVSFGGLSEESMYDSLQEFLNVANSNAVADVELTFWVWWPGTPFQLPPEDGIGFLWAPTAPPSPQLPLLVGVDQPDHPWGTDGGYIHPVDMTRRVWDALGLRYDSDNLDTLEALDEGMAFLAAAPSVEDATVDPERWMEHNIWGPSGLIALKDGAGRRKLVDARFHREDLDVEALAVLNTTNTKHHRWRLVGEELRNRFIVHYHSYRNPVDGETPERLDFFVAEDRQSENYDSDNVAFINPRPYEVNGRQFLAPHEPLSLHIAMLAQERGNSWRVLEAPMMQAALEIFQDGPVRYSGEIGKTLADVHEEGSYVVIDESELKGANPDTESRFGGVLVMFLSLSRHPAYAPYEAIRIRPAELGVLPPPTADTPEWGGYTFFTDLHPCAPSGDLHQSTDLRFACFIWCEEPECGGDGGWVVWWTNDADDLALGCASPNNPFGYLL